MKDDASAQLEFIALHGLDLDREKTIKLAHLISQYLTARGINIWLEYGSALGAVREGGFIEGDHDIDLAIWWRDWEKLKQSLLMISEITTIPFIYVFKKSPSGGEICQLFTKRDPGSHSKTKKLGDEFVWLDIYGFQEYNEIRSSAVIFGSAFRSKLYYQQNLKKIQFEGLEFYISKYIEKYLDYRYKDAGGKGVTWRTPIRKNEVKNWEEAIPSFHEEDKIVGCVMGVFDLFHIGHLRLLKRSSEIFDKVVAVVHSDLAVMEHEKKKPVIPYEHRIEIVSSCKYVDEVIDAPVRHLSIEHLNNNKLDYLVHGKRGQHFLEEHYSEIIKEHRLLLLDDTKDYHTDDIIKYILR